MLRLFLECALRATLLLAGTAIILYALRVKSAAAKHAVWTGVLLLMLLLPAWTAWGPKAPLRLLPPLPAQPAVHTLASTDAFSTPIPVLQQDSTSLKISEPRALNFVVTWRAVLLAVYLLGLFSLLLRLAIGTMRSRTLIRQSTLHDGKLTTPLCAAPVTVGFLHPVVILPEHWREWPHAQLHAVTIHEDEHARRRDPLVQWLALLNRALFWFHPAAWWLERHLSSLAEEACDNVVLARGHSPRDYAEYLLDIARSVLQSGTRLNIAGMAMPGSGLPRRIRQILEAAPVPRISRAHMTCVALVCAMTGTLFAAGTLDHARPSVSAQSAGTQSVRISALEALQERLNFRPADDRQNAALLPESSVPSQPFVERVVFDGNRRMRSETLAARIFTRAGDPYNEGALGRDFNANTRYFQYVRLDVQDSPSRPNGKIVVFHLVERPIIRRIEYTGIKSLTVSDVLDRFKEREVGLTLESQLDLTKVAKAEVALQELLAERGHPLAVVKPTYERIPNTNAVKLVITVDEGPAADPLDHALVGGPKVSLSSQSSGVPTSVTNRPKFDSVTIRVNVSGDKPPGVGRTTANTSLALLMVSAYQLPESQFVGLPDWAHADRFDIQAKAAGNLGSDQTNPMWQSVLADRFKLVMHHETRQLPFYELAMVMPGRLGPQVHRNDKKCDPQAAMGSPFALACGNVSLRRTTRGLVYSVQGMTIQQFVAALAGFGSNEKPDRWGMNRNIDRPIVDRTGLKEKFDLTLEFEPQWPGFDAVSGPAAPPSLFTALKEQLGLGLEPRTGPVDVLVIDHVERPFNGSF